MSVSQALDQTRTGDVWLFRGHSGPDRAIQTMSNSPVNHVGMTVAIEDLPPLMWHAELGDKLTDVWTATNHRGVQLNDAREAIERWLLLRAAVLAAADDTGYRPRPGEPAAARHRPDGRHAVSVHDPAHPAVAARSASDQLRLGARASVDRHQVRDSTRRRRAEQRKGSFESAYCAETVAVTYEEMGLIETEKRTNWFDPGRFWSGDDLPLIAPFRLGSEIAVVAD